MMPEVIDEEILYQNGSFSRRRRWLRGHHPHLGVLIWGLTGPETFQEICTVKPTITVTVLPAPPESGV